MRTPPQRGRRTVGTRDPRKLRIANIGFSSLTVTFAPEAVAAHSATLTIVNQDRVVNVHLQGEGL